MIHGSNQNIGYTPYVGLGVVIPLKANPTNEEYKQITGQDAPFDMTYEMRNESFAISILCKGVNTDRYDFIRFYLSDEEEKSSTGSILFMNEVGDFFWSPSKEDALENEKLSKFTAYTFAPAMRGMRQLYSFLQKLVLYNSRSEDARWLKDMAENKILFDDLFNHMNVDGLNKLLTWANGEHHSVVCLYSVKEKISENGNLNYVQVLETGSGATDLFFRSQRGLVAPEVPASAVTYLSALEQSAFARGSKLLNRHYYVGVAMPFTPTQVDVSSETVSELPNISNVV